MPTAGPNNPGTAANVDVAVSSDWVNPSNALSSNNSWAVNTVVAFTVSDYLTLTNFGFALPASATILGIEAAIERNGSVSKIQDSGLYLVKAGSRVGSNLAATGTNWPVATDATANYGGVSNLWGTTWTYSEINASNFGIALSCTNAATDGDANVDLITITITYSTGLPPGKLVATRQAIHRASYY